MTDSTPDTWLKDFEAANPSQKHSLLLTALKSSEMFGDDVLTAAAVNVSQLLAEHNQLEALAELMHALAGRPAAKVLEPAWRLLSIQDALFNLQTEKLPALLQDLEQFSEDVPAEQWADLLDELAFYGQSAAATQLAHGLQARLGEKALEREEALAFAVERHQVMPAIEAYWRSGGTEADQQAFEQALIQADFEPEDFPALTSLRDLSAQAQLGKLKQAFRDREIDAGILPAQLAFGRWMLETHGMNLLTSSQILEQSFALWELTPEQKRPEFAKWAQIKPTDFDDYCAHLAHETGPDAFVLLWGLPFVNDWLLSVGLSNLFVSHHLLSLLPAAREKLIAERDLAVWTGGFVLNWPVPEHLPESPGNEREHFVASRKKSQPLSQEAGSKDSARHVH